jgi:hypothetical protein
VKKKAHKYATTGYPEFPVGTKVTYRYAAPEGLNPQDVFTVVGVARGGETIIQGSSLNKNIKVKVSNRHISKEV